MNRIALAACLAALLTSACTLPEAKGPVRVCVPDSAICYFEDR